MVYTQPLYKLHRINNGITHYKNLHSLPLKKQGTQSNPRHLFKSQTWNKCTDIMHTQKYRDKIHMLIDKIFHFNPQWNLIFLALIFQTLIDKISFTSIRTVSSRRLSPHLLPFHHWCNRRDQFKPWMRFLPSKSHVTRCVLNSPIDMNRQKIH